MENNELLSRSLQRTIVVVVVAAAVSFSCFCFCCGGDGGNRLQLQLFIKNKNNFLWVPSKRLSLFKRADWLMRYDDTGFFSPFLLSIPPWADLIPSPQSSIRTCWPRPARGGERVLLRTGAERCVEMSAGVTAKATMKQLDRCRTVSVVIGGRARRGRVWKRIGTRNATVIYE